MKFTTHHDRGTKLPKGTTVESNEMVEAYQNLALEIDGLLRQIDEKCVTCVDEMMGEPGAMGEVNEIMDFRRTLMSAINEHPFYLQGLHENDIEMGRTTRDEG